MCPTRHPLGTPPLLPALHPQLFALPLPDVGIEEIQPVDGVPKWLEPLALWPRLKLVHQKQPFTRPLLALRRLDEVMCVAEA